eukprot:jgi/Chlat1/4085/Chrsp26S08851
MPFGQIVVGPPGSGKTTYCNGIQHFFHLTGRQAAVINLDPANDNLPYECAVNIEELITLKDVMEQQKLGPNGGLVFCMDYLLENIDWLQEKLKPLHDEYYLLFDFPGQVELFSLHSSTKQIIQTMTDDWNYRLTAVHLVDAHLCSDPAKYISALLLSLGTMLHLELPHVNVLSKVDLIEQYGRLAFNLDFYTEVQDLQYLVQSMHDDAFSKRFRLYYPNTRKLSEALCEIVQDFSLVGFTTLNIQDKESVLRLVRLIDKSNGYVFTGLEGSNVSLGQAYAKYASAEPEWDWDKTAAVQEKYMVDPAEEVEPQPMKTDVT